MNVYSFWERITGHATDKDGFDYHLISWGGSNKGPEEAKKKAQERLAGWQKKINGGEDLEHYSYSLDPEIREELLESFTDDTDTTYAAITRNRYGSLILNTSAVFFADIDLPSPPKLGFWKRLFGESAAERKQRAQTLCRQRLEQFSTEHPDICYRLYETHAGYRLIITNALFEATSEATQKLLAALHSDTLYATLCKNQACFRARLSAKPWRCRCSRPPNSFPRVEAEAQQAYEQWLSHYEQESKQYTVCRLVDEKGAGRHHEEVAKVLLIHDKICLDADKALA